MTVAEVHLWGRRIGAVTLADDSTTAVFAYDREFARSGIEVAPLTMPLQAERPYAFPNLSPETFRGLPGLLADALPDRFGNALIDAWIASQGRPPDDFDVVERLCYIGTRAMGALEFVPARGPRPRTGETLQISTLVDLAAEVLTQRERFAASLREHGHEAAMRDILMVGTSAGGARAKAVIAWNEATGEVRSGQVDAGDGFGQWLLKFDGVSGDPTRELDGTEGYGAREYAYHLMARDAGIAMSECRLLPENGRRHFMTRRFDRLPGGGKLHMQSLGALAHFDFNLAGAYSYEQALLTIRRLGLPMDAVEQQFRRAAFNVVARNQDDHVKNIAFLMDRSGAWSLSPAFDVTYAYNPSGAQTRVHQMSLNGKRDGFAVEDFRACGVTASLRRGRAETILREVREAVMRWPQHAAAAGVPESDAVRIARTHRIDLPRG
ncbi:MAG TPA: type II toxin-antitoxin system HipA family toxin [Conexibacter sp.]|nr:type II toxin-antitoxin system HipA family toxin [Conexibacter sp.]